MPVRKSRSARLEPEWPHGIRARDFPGSQSPGRRRRGRQEFGSRQARCRRPFLSNMPFHHAGSSRFRLAYGHLIKPGASRALAIRSSSNIAHYFCGKYVGNWGEPGSSTRRDCTILTRRNRKPRRHRGCPASKRVTIQYGSAWSANGADRK
jgi:hypothetical protein